MAEIGQQAMGSDVGGRIRDTLEGSVTKMPDRKELAWDALLAGAAIFEAVSAPVAIAGMALNRLIHAAR